jgi:hypothetical protein
MIIIWAETLEAARQQLRQQAPSDWQSFHDAAESTVLPGQPLSIYLPLYNLKTYFSLSSGSKVKAELSDSSAIDA